jgi:hypothetical protein
MFRSNHARHASALLLSALLCAALPTTGWTWGSEGHHYIAQHYSQHLPAGIDGLRAYDATVDAHVTDPDTRKGSTPGESEKHYIDIDWYPQFLAGTLPRSRSALETLYGAPTVRNNGILPWAIADVVGALESQFRAGQWDTAALTIADLCHYVGDLNLPLHCTWNYDGAMTGNDGIHSRYESTMISDYLALLSTPPMSVTYCASPLDAAFDLVACSWAGVSPILTADDTARAAAGGPYDATYYASLWSGTRTLTQARLDTATVMTASLVYTAWVDAGRPAVGSGPGVFLRAGPSPFDDHLHVYFNAAGPLSVDVFDVRGARVAHLADGVPGGSVTWKTRDSDVPVKPGLYFVRLNGPGTSLVRKVTLCPRPRPSAR